MSKHHPHPKGEGVKLVGSPDKLTDLILKDIEERKYVLNQVVNEGPKHKQVLSALLLKRAYKLIQVVEKSTVLHSHCNQVTNLRLKRKKEKSCYPSGCQ